MGLENFITILGGMGSIMGIVLFFLVGREKLSDENIQIYIIILFLLATLVSVLFFLTLL